MTFLVAVGIMALFACVVQLLKENRRLYKDNLQKTQKLEATIKELKAAQIKLLESGKTSALASLSAGILHQISQPITAIHGFIRFMKKEMKPEDVFYKPVMMMDEQSTYIRDMLENLMELVRHRKIQKDAVDVNSVLAKAMNLLSDELRIRRVGWDMQMEEELPEVFADPLHLQQVFMNMTVNAMEALSEKAAGLTRTLEVSTEWDKEKKMVIVRFKDNGSGIDPEEQKRIFDPFFSTKEKGSGVGLALCHDLIVEHGGRIEVASSPEGTVFSIYLPCLVKAV
ncbi:MAG: GHKL domain-containing protein [Candidatus Omnitrophica bacterium]|nr:GHKL domain-containing protein [Candidatus Omnitrophota bacterium]